MKHLYSFKTKPEKTCAVIRYGAIGDVVQASSVLPYLKQEGYHVTFYCTPLGYEVIKLDPHVDRFVVQDVDIVPNPRLGEFWESLVKKYTKVINLSESVERTLLAMPGNMNHTWSHEMRHKHLNKNYMEFVHDIAGVSGPARMKFYESKEERAWAQQEYARIGGKVILWVLSGSAVHKVWPYMDNVIDAVLRSRPEARFVLVGEPDAKILQMGWENTPQVHCKAGAWTIRQALAFAQAADLVIGPETGITNAMAYESVEKIVLLSHSSKENLTRDWLNCVSLTPQNTPCYPCHRLHTVADGFKHCTESTEVPGIAACQANIPARDMYAAINATFIHNRKAA